jgi:hypothetical protein
MWMKGMIGMSEMTLQECIARLEFTNWLNSPADSQNQKLEGLK